MNKININWDGVVIGSNTIAEHKNQVLNFMNMIYDIAFCNADRGNINPWFGNLKYEISCLRWDKYHNTYACKIEQHIDALREKIINRQPCKKDWENLLKGLASLFEIEYTLN